MEKMHRQLKLDPESSKTCEEFSISNRLDKVKDK